MTSGADQVADDPLAAAGATRWLSIHDDLLRALAHAISNRLGSVGMTAAVLEAGRPADARLVDALRDDADRLEQLLLQLRQLPRHAEASSEPMLPVDAVRAAVRLVAEHPDLRHRTVEVTGGPEVPPVYAEPTALTQAVAVLVLAAARHNAYDQPLTVGLEAAGDRVRIRVVGAATDHTPDALDVADGQAIRWLLRADHGDAIVDATGLSLTLPTLQAARQLAG